MHKMHTYILIAAPIGQILLPTAFKRWQLSLAASSAATEDPHSHRIHLQASDNTGRYFKLLFKICNLQHTE